MKLAWQQIPSTVITEIFCNGKFDGVVLDTEHGCFNDEDVYRGCCHLPDVDDFLGYHGFKRVLIEYPMRTPTERYTWGDALAQ